jgi:hypothetical protein
MRWSSWSMPLLLLLLGYGPVWSQTASPSPSSPAGSERYFYVGNPPEKCRVLRSWQLADGRQAYEVQVVATGEVRTLYELPERPSREGGVWHRLRQRFAQWRSGPSAREDGEIVWAEPGDCPICGGSAGCTSGCSSPAAAGSAPAAARSPYPAPIMPLPDHISSTPVVVEAPPATAHPAEKKASPASIPGKMTAQAKPLTPEGDIPPPPVPDLPSVPAPAPAGPAAGQKPASSTKVTSPAEKAPAASSSSTTRNWEQQWMPAPVPTSSVPASNNARSPASAAAPGSGTPIPSSPPLFPSTTAKTGSASAPAPSLPISRTEKGAKDPLTGPPSYAPPAVQRELQSNPAPAKNWPTPAGLATAPVAQTPANAPTASKKEEPLGGRTPLGAASVLAAYDNTDKGVRYIPVPLVTVPQPSTPPQPPAPQLPQPPQPVPFTNAFTPQAGKNGAPPVFVNAFTPPAPASSASMPAGGSAFTTPVNPKQATGWMGTWPGSYPPVGMPASAAAYPPARIPQMSAAPAMYPPGTLLALARPAAWPYANPAMDRPGVPVTLPAAGSEQAPALSQMLDVLKNSLLPSQREWAAEYLSRLDWRRHPEVLSALTTAARDDPAATVRLACVRCLGRMDVSADLLRSTLTALQNDPSAEVRTAAAQVLGQREPAGDAAVRPASAGPR